MRTLKRTLSVALAGAMVASVFVFPAAAVANPVTDAWYGDASSANGTSVYYEDAATYSVVTVQTEELTGEDLYVEFTQTVAGVTAVSGSTFTAVADSGILKISGIDGTTEFAGASVDNDTQWSTPDLTVEFADSTYGDVSLYANASIDVSTLTDVSTVSVVYASGGDYHQDTIAANSSIVIDLDTEAYLVLTPAAGKTVTASDVELTSASGTATATAVYDALENNAGTTLYDPYSGQLCLDLTGLTSAAYTLKVTASTAATITESAIDLTAPAAGETAETTVEGTQFVGTVAWSPALVSGAFADGTDYTATITLAAKSGYTLDGVTADFFTVGSVSGTNTAGSGVVTVTFPTTKTAPTASDFTYTAPTSLTYDGAAHAATVAAVNASTMSSFTVEYLDTGVTGATATTTAPTNAGTYEVYANVAGNATYDAAMVLLDTFTIVPASINVTAATVADKTYDATTDATVTDVTFTGLVNSETLTLGTDYTAVGAFATADVGTGKTVTVTVTLGSTTKAGNYVLGTATASTTADITAKEIGGLVGITVTDTNGDSIINDGDVLTADTANVTGIASGDTVAYTYQWYKDETAISGETNAAYTITSSDTDGVFTVEVTAGGNYTGTLTSTSVQEGKYILGGTIVIDYSNGTAVGDVLGIDMANATPSTVTTSDYTIQWMRDGVAISGATSDTYTVTSDDIGKTISVVLTGTGDYTGTLIASITIPATVPSAPSLSASTGSQRVTLTWTTPFDGGSEITSYVLTYYPTSNSSSSTTVTLALSDLTVSGSSNSYVVTGLTNSTNYTFELYAVNAKGSGAVGTVTATPSSGSSGGSGGGGGSTTYKVTINTTGSGKVTASSTNVTRGSSVTLTITPNSGATLTRLVVDGTDVTDSITDNGDGTFSYVISNVRAAVTVTATFTTAVPAASSINDFTDIRGHWAYDAIAYVFNAGLMTGMSSTTFVPDGVTSRAQLVTVLYRLAGEPTVTTSAGFSDLNQSWYMDAVNWAAETGVTEGVSETRFDPDSAVTREQVVTFFYRYMEVEGYTISGATELTAFSDAGSVSDYAADGMKWAVGNGIITGMTATTLSPASSSTRAQIATILQRFCTQIDTGSTTATTDDTTTDEDTTTTTDDDTTTDEDDTTTEES